MATKKSKKQQRRPSKDHYVFASLAFELSAQLPANAAERVRKALNKIDWQATLASEGVKITWSECEVHDDLTMTD